MEWHTGVRNNIGNLQRLVAHYTQYLPVEARRGPGVMIDSRILEVSVPDPHGHTRMRDILYHSLAATIENRRPHTERRNL